MSKLKMDLKRYMHGSNLIMRLLCLIYYTSIPAIVIYRLLNWFYCKKNVFSKMCYYFLFFLIYVPYKQIRGVEIHPEATISGGLFIPHCTSIFISKDAVIGENVTIHQGTTLGINYNTNESPVIGDNVLVGANVTLIGGIRIGNNSIIMANSAVTKTFSDNLIIGGVPAKIIKDNNEVTN